MVDAVAAGWDVLDDEYMRARAIDLRSVAQVLARVLGVPVPAPRLDEPGILVAADLTPADTAGLDPAMTLGIVTVHGGPTSHAAVLARALGIPAVVGVGPRVLSLAEGSSLAVDGASGEVVVDPPPDVVARFESERRERAERLAGLLASAGEPATTIDGTTVEVAANVGGPAEVTAASPRAPTASGCSAPSSSSWTAPPCRTRTSRRPPIAQPARRSTDGRSWSARA